MSFIEGTDRSQVSLLPPCVDDYVAPDALVRVVDAFVSSLNLGELGFGRTVAAATGRPGYDPSDMLRLYIWGYLNQVRSSRHLERAGFVMYFGGPRRRVRPSGACCRKTGVCRRPKSRHPQSQRWVVRTNRFHGMSLRTLRF